MVRVVVFLYQKQDDLQTETRQWLFLIFRSSSNIGMVFCPASSGGELRPILLLFCVLHACNKGVCLLSVNIKQDIGPPNTETIHNFAIQQPQKMYKNNLVFFSKQFFLSLQNPSGRRILTGWCPTMTASQFSVSSPAAAPSPFTRR